MIMTPSQIILTYFLSNLVAITFFFISLKWKILARALYAGLFMWAAWLNWSIAHTNPAFYLNYSKYALGWYRDFILGSFSYYITPFVSFIAICQFFIGLGQLSGGIIFKISCIGGIIFLIAIAPLGFLSAFPSGLTWSAGLLVLYKSPFNKNIFSSQFNKNHQYK
jgi:hypothetical protein